MKYLYGASIQGIQSFIFQTNKLTEIVGASQLVEEICRDLFKSFLGNDFKDENLILAAAGNIKYLFTTKESCERTVREFPKKAMLYAPGITISQSVVPWTENNDDFQQLEDRLKIQRNKAVSVTQGISLMALETARRTGGIVVGLDNKENDLIDLPQMLKRKAADKAGKVTLERKLLGDESKQGKAFPKEMDEIKDAKNWVAVIHADGNNLGQLLLSLSEKVKSEYPTALKKFSEILNDSTISAAKRALEETFLGDESLSFRPIVLGGDDMTVIIRADRAVQFTKVFLKNFEELTRQNFSTFYPTINLIPHGLTACAGIAYIKSSYPFHYGADLAETLCKEAKAKSKRINSDVAPSSLVFHKVHSSFVLEEYEDIISKELTAKRLIEKNQENDEAVESKLYFNYGPYFIKPQKNGFATIDQLERWVNEVNRSESPRSGLRNWLTDVKSNRVRAYETMARIREIAGKHYTEKLSLNNVEVKRDDGKWYTHLFDVLSLASIQSQHNPA